MSGQKVSWVLLLSLRGLNVLHTPYGELSPCATVTLTTAGAYTPGDLYFRERGCPPLTGYQAQSDQIQSAANHVREIRDQVMTQINQLQGAVEQMASSWQGDAARAFDGTMQKFNSEEFKLRNALSGIADALDASKTTYLSTEADQAASISQVSAALDG